MSYQAYLSQTQRIQSCKSDQYCPKYGNFILIIFAILFYFTCSISHAQDKKQTCQAIILEQQLTKATGDAIPNSQNNWVTIKEFPDFIEDHWQYYSGSVWYKIRWNYHCPTPKQNPITLMISHINMAGQIYLNDELLWQDQSLVEPLSRSWNMPRYWNLPASSLHSGENIIWVRVVAVATQNSGIGHIFLGHADDVIPKYNEFWYQQRVLLFFNLIFSLTLGIIAFLIWLFHRKDSVFGWFAVTSLAWIMIMGNIVILKTPFDLETLKIARFNMSVIIAYAVFSCFYAWRLAKRNFPRLEKFLIFLLITVIFLAVFLPDNIIWLDYFLKIYFTIAVIILFLHFISYPFFAWQSKRLEAKLLASVFIIYIIAIIHDILIICRLIESSPIIAYTAPLATLFIAIILAMRLANNVKKIEQFNKTLEENIIQAKDELSTSLTYQHQLELENTRLQERMNLAHDLHDGLGSSLVRSMALIDQSKENLTNPQFLSMLKLLRDDLRQIIDTGSSSGAKVPETPILWGAAVRYRFIQIFDELDIQSSWFFPETWQTKPSALECLTLLRVIEESLTNIIKHSQATQVKVHFSYTNPTQLILSIQDNGIGFDPKIVMQSGISVGIRSMQIRLSKIQAKMHIESQSGKTLIQIIKDFNQPQT